jgi:phosphatidylglycerophosphate synthase
MLLSSHSQKEHRMAMKNVGAADRAVRVVIGLVLIALVFVGPKTPWGWIGLIPLLTGLISFCPLYRVLGIRTCKN